MQFYDQYVNLRARLAPFKVKTDHETIKTVAAIEYLAFRANTIHFGNKPGVILPCPPGINEENLMQRAENHLAALEKGEFPLKGKFTEPGVSFNDHSIFIEDGKVHIFYAGSTVGYDWPERNVDVVRHVVTENLLDWESMPIALSIEQNWYENHGVWAPSVVKKDDTYYMYYTGVSKNITQSTCMATSKDLIVWKKYKNNPVYTPGKWSPWNKDEWSDNRDVMIFEDNNIFYMYYCVMRYTDDGKSITNSIGIASSINMINWKHENVFSLEGCKYMPESPFVIKHNEKYYLFYTNCSVGTSYAISDNPIKDFKVMGALITEGAANDGDTATVPSCSEVFEFKGKWYITYATRLPGNEQYLEIKELFWNDDGTVSTGEQIK